MKSYMNTDQMIEYLETTKKILVEKEDVHWLEEINYMNLIHPFKELFSCGKSKDGTYYYKYFVDLKEYIKVFEIESNFSNELHKDIRMFERKFKNIIFDELCKEYVEKYNDTYCIRYIDEIEYFLNGGHEIPMFCTNIDKVLTKYGYKDDFYDLDKRKDVLKKIYLYGSKLKNRSNLLLKQYQDKYEFVPLWIISNVLTLGEIIMIYSMLDIRLQNRIYERIFDGGFIKNNEVIEFKRLNRFIAKLEYLRKVRNIISHFTPLFPFILKTSKSKLNQRANIISLLQLLNPRYNYDRRNIIELKEYLNLSIVISPHNLLHIQVLLLMIDYLNFKPK